MTAGGILAWTDLGLTLVERLLGPGTMLATARFLLVDPPRQAQGVYKAFIPNFEHGDAAVLRVQHLLHAASHTAHSVPDLAAHAGLADRTFLRRFVRATGARPTEYLQQVRVMKARDALELSNDNVDRIAWRVGYTDPSAFRRLFQRITGVSPQAYRERFGRSRFAVDGNDRRRRASASASGRPDEHQLGSSEGFRHEAQFGRCLNRLLRAQVYRGTPFPHRSDPREGGKALIVPRTGEIVQRYERRVCREQ
jgi:AraC-like DNA-binding protein